MREERERKTAKKESRRVVVPWFKKSFPKDHFYKALPFPFLSLSAVLTSPLLVKSSNLNFSAVSSTRISIYRKSTLLNQLEHEHSSRGISDEHSTFLVSHHEQVRLCFDTRLVQDVFLLRVLKYASFRLESIQQGSPTLAEESITVHYTGM